jgi:hypothetical protein
MRKGGWGGGGGGGRTRVHCTPYPAVWACLSLQVMLHPCFQRIFHSLGCRLDRSFAHLDRFTRLETLVLDKNELSDLAGCPRIEGLKTLWFNKNRVTDLAHFLDQVQALFPRLVWRWWCGSGGPLARPPGAHPVSVPFPWCVPTPDHVVPDGQPSVAAVAERV